MNWQNATADPVWPDASERRLRAECSVPTGWRFGHPAISSGGMQPEDLRLLRSVAVGQVKVPGGSDDSKGMFRELR